MKRKNFIQPLFFSLALIGMIVLSGCSGGSSTESTQAMPALADKTWELTSLNGAEVLPEVKASLYFGASNNLVGYSGCNLMNGSYNVSGKQISLDSSLASSFDCANAVKVQEQALLTVLDSASSYLIEGDRLELSNPDGSYRAELTLLPDAGLKGTSWNLNSFNDGQGAFVLVLPGTEITADFAEDGTLSGSAGCNNYNTTFEETANNKVTINEAIASTMMACADPEGVMEQETQYLTVLPSSAQYINLQAFMLLQQENGSPVGLYYAAVK